MNSFCKSKNEIHAIIIHTIIATTLNSKLLSNDESVLFSIMTYTLIFYKNVLFASPRLFFKVDAAPRRLNIPSPALQLHPKAKIPR